jgi:predicted small metal-binding protein
LCRARRDLTVFLDRTLSLVLLMAALLALVIPPAARLAGRRRGAGAPPAFAGEGCSRHALPAPVAAANMAQTRAGRGRAMAKRINCVCGFVVRGETDDELWGNAQAHLRTDHPDLVGKVSREDILAQAEEE